jgi:6-phosphogluconate dehydrogenase
MPDIPDVTAGFRAGLGHLVKTVIDIEYDKAKELHDVFAEWNQGELKSYLIEITANIFAKVDPDTGKPLVEVIDGGQKFKALLAGDATLGADGKPVLSLEAKALVVKLFSLGHDGAQDQSTIDVVKDVKATL